MLNEYYKETDPAKRKALLDQLTEEHCDATELAQIKALFAERYALNKKGGYIDRFVGAWLELKIVVSNRFGNLSKTRNAKQIRAALHTLCLDRQEEFPRALLYREMTHLILVYKSACAVDSNYNSFLWGLGRISDERYDAKLTGDLKQVRDGVLLYLPEEESFSVLKNAITDTLGA